MAHARNSVELYEGTEKEEFSQFEQLFQGYVRIAGNDPGQQANFFQLNLRNNALRFYQTLGPATREKARASLIALRDLFCNAQLQEFHVLKLEQLRLKLNYHQLNCKLPMEPLYQGCDHQSKFVTFVEELGRQQVNAGCEKNHKDAVKTSRSRVSRKIIKPPSQLPKSSKLPKSSSNETIQHYKISVFRQNFSERNHTDAHRKTFLIWITIKRHGRYRRLCKCYSKKDI